MFFFSLLGQSLMFFTLDGPLFGSLGVRVQDAAGFTRPPHGPALKGFNEEHPLPI